MTRSRFSGEQIVAILKEHEAGLSVADLCRKHAINVTSFWQGKRLKTLEDENTRLQELLADALLDNAILKDLLGKKWWRKVAPRAGPPANATLNSIGRYI
jgi:putative transposase